MAEESSWWDTFTDWWDSDTPTYDETDYLDGGAASDSSWWDTISDWGGQAWDYVSDIDFSDPSKTGLAEDVVNMFKDKDGNFDPTKLAGTVGGVASIASALGLLGSGDDQRITGYQGEIPKYTAVRQRVGDTYDPTRRPGSGGQRYFSDMTFATDEQIPAAQESAIQQAATLRQANIDNPAQQRTPAAQPVAMMRGGIARLQGGGEPAQAPVTPMTRQDLIKLYETDPRAAFKKIMTGEVGGKPQSMSYARTYLEMLKKAQAAGQLPSQQQQNPQPAQQTAPMGSGMAQGGIASVKPKGYYLGGVTDGMADKVPATIDNQQPAALSDGEFVIPADVVSHLGNGNSNAGAQQLYSMMDNIRQARTGTKKQGTQINPSKFMPA